MNKWEAYRLPDDLTGKTFLDVGCWEGHWCAEAVRRNSSSVVGVDLCTSESLRENVERYGFDFLQLDVLSEKFLELDRFDLVLCSGVLYHVESPLSLLFRLRKTVTELLVLETAANRLCPDQPVLLFHPHSDLKDNPSNWWTPNERCLSAMLEACGFLEVRTVYRRAVDDRIERICVHASPSGTPSYAKLLPRNEHLMSLFGGERKRKPRDA